MDIAQLLLQPSGPQPDALRISQEQKLGQTARVGAQDEELKTVAKQFEGIFVNQILKQMQETLSESSADPEDSSGEQVHGLYCTFLADAVAERGGLGLWEKIYEQMKQRQATDDGSSTINASV